MFACQLSLGVALEQSCRARRVCIINNFGVVILDAYVRPAAPVTDFRTKYSGVRKRNLVGAPSLQEVRPRVAKLIAGRVLIGHALHNDFKVHCCACAF